MPKFCPYLSDYKHEVPCREHSCTHYVQLPQSDEFVCHDEYQRRVLYTQLTHLQQLMQSTDLHRDLHKQVVRAQLTGQVDDGLLSAAELSKRLKS